MLLGFLVGVFPIMHFFATPIPAMLLARAVFTSLYRPVTVALHVPAGR